MNTQRRIQFWAGEALCRVGTTATQVNRMAARGPESPYRASVLFEQGGRQLVGEPGMTMTQSCIALSGGALCEQAFSLTLFFLEGLAIQHSQSRE